MLSKSLHILVHDTYAQSTAGVCMLVPPVVLYTTDLSPAQSRLERKAVCILHKQPIDQKGGICASLETHIQVNLHGTAMNLIPHIFYTGHWLKHGSTDHICAHSILMIVQYKTWHEDTPPMPFHTRSELGKEVFQVKHLTLHYVSQEIHFKKTIWQF